MSYLKKIEYKIVPSQSFSVIRNCSGCDRKVHFKNTKRFRVNANGNKLDVWLIYQCENCKHTFNLTIYERQKPSSVPNEEYKGFLSNDEDLAEEFGRNVQLFKRNKAEIDFEDAGYQFVKLQEETDENHSGQQVNIIINNPYNLKIRPERQIAEILGISRSCVKKMMEHGEITAEVTSSQSVSANVHGLKDNPWSLE